jgi:hypothetical protein
MIVNHHDGDDAADHPQTKSVCQSQPQGWGQPGQPVWEVRHFHRNISPDRLIIMPERKKMEMSDKVDA